MASLADATRAELDRLGAHYFLDIRATARRLLEGMAGPARAAFAAAVTERLLRENERRPARERRPYGETWRPVLEAVWRGLGGDALAVRQVAAAVARFYVSPDWYDRRHDDPADADDHAIMAACYAAECCLHGCLDFACWAGWRGFDAATLRAAGDTGWPHRRPAGVSGYAWELAHPCIQSELEQQLSDLELLAGDGGVLIDPAADRRPLLDRLRESEPDHPQPPEAQPSSN
ncbi:MAG TPA: hypothetical protein VIL37_03970 [Natronosporangium sp.]